MLQRTKPRTAERRQHERVDGLPIQPPGLVMVNIEGPSEPIADVRVLNLSERGAALRCSGPVVPGQRVAFTITQDRAPVLCSVVGCERMEDGWFRVRCKCILGGFDLD